MASIIMKQVDAFTTKPFCGNPAAILLHAESFSAETMQQIAAENCTLESAFVTPPDSPEAAHRVRFFTSDLEADFSGHALLAACFALAEEGMVHLDHGVTQVLIETNAGIIPVEYYADLNAKPAPQSKGASAESVPLVVGGRPIGVLERIMIQQTMPGFKPTNVQASDIAKTLGIPVSEISATGLPVQIVRTGLAQMLVPIRSRETIAGLCPDLIKLRLLNKKLDVLSTEVFSLETNNEGSAVYSRHFAPAMGMWEVDASGAGAASIAAYLISHGAVSPGLMMMEQGPDVDRLTRVVVQVGEMENGNIPVQFGGLAVTSTTREVTLQSEEPAIS